MMSKHPKSDSTRSGRTGSNRRSNPVASAIAAIAILTLAGCGGEQEPTGKAEAGKEAQIEAKTNGAPAVVVAEPAAGEPGSDERAAGFAADAGGRVAEKPSVRGDDPAWFFLVRELKQLALGKFWERDWSELAQNKTDPIPSMVEFHNLLKEAGVELIVVPVPAKASIYPDKLSSGFAPGDPSTLAPLIERLQSEGLNVLDIEQQMRQRRSEKPDEKLWCEQDAHYTPLTCEIISGLVKTGLEGKGWFDSHPKEEIVRTEPMKLEITGDQVVGSEWEGQVPKETLTIRYAGRDSDGDGGNLEPVEPDRESPVLLLGDSHTLVFQEGASGGLHCKGAGLFDQLAYEFQFAPDLVGVRGSGLVQARKQLFFTASPIAGYWEKKKVVIWVFSSREFTQSFDKIMSIPIKKP